MMDSIDTVDACMSGRRSDLDPPDKMRLEFLDGTTVKKKKQELEERMLKREEARFIKAVKRKEEQLKKSAENEKSEYFNNTFSSMKSSIEAKIAEADLVEKESLIDYFDLVTKDYQNLEKFVADSTIFLSSYDVRMAQEKLRTLLQDLHTKQNTLLPKKKFAFRNRKKRETSVGRDTIDASRKVNNAMTPDQDDQLAFDIEGLSDEIIIRNNDEIHGKHISIGNLMNCSVYLYGVPSTLHVQELHNCRIFTGPVATSMFVSNCDQCVFVTACQQLRVHSTKNSTFYMHVYSRAIIEDSTALKFAPYNLHYSGIEEHFKETGFDMDNFNWTAIDDFNWLARDVPSPNWSEMPEDKRVKSWDTV